MRRFLCIWFVLGLVSMDVLITPDLSFSDSSQLLAAAAPSEGDSIQSVEEMTGEPTEIRTTGGRSNRQSISI